MSEDEVEVLYIVEGILNKRFDREGKPEYYVKWKGFKQRTWQPIDNLLNVPEMIYEYEEANKQKRRQHADLNPKKAVRELKETVVGRKKKLVKIAHKENEMNNMIELDSSVENRKSDYMVSSRDQFEQYKEEVSHSPRDQPRVKFTRELPHDSHDIVGRVQKPSLYSDQVQRITAVQRRGDKWMARVRFGISDQQVWQERDIVRLLHPMRLLEFYEQLHHQRQKQ